jgi:sugar lactone lactonase YvrE
MQTLADGFTYLECPRWHQDRLWVSDFYTHQVVKIDLHGGVERVAQIPQQPSGLGFLPDGRALIVSMRDRRILRLEPDGQLQVHADLMEHAPWHLNDMVVDARGRAYVGNFGFDLMGGAPEATTCILRVDPDGRIAVAADALMFPNGSAITPDGRTLIVSESFAGRLSAFSIDADGNLGQRRIWAELGRPYRELQQPGTDPDTVAIPDGLCLDAEGAVWVADALRHCVLRIGEGGRELQRISTGDLGVYACMLGGADGRTLFLCAAPSFDEAERSAEREGRLLVTQVQVPHAGLP